ncbi:MAG TPA: NAD(P)-binding domain-containing protein [Candidatus Cybelea sp.]|nr:NAD(P)-binding domain-containing protein [Candidatus Cybelea sp.]
MNTFDAIILGAGPYGLAASAHLRLIEGFALRTFGDPMSFWRSQMPAGMLLRSSWEASHIADPTGSLTLDRYKTVSSNHLPMPVPLNRFVDYGLWFQKNAVPDLDCRKITRVGAEAGGFRVSLEDGEELRTRRFIVAGGIAPFAWRPPEFAALPPSLAGHSSEYADLRPFRGRRVAVIGAGQSALESATLLDEIGAEVEVLARTPHIHWLGWKARFQRLGPASKLLFSWTDVGPAGISRLVSVPAAMRVLPQKWQDSLRKRSIRPAGAHWLVGRCRGVRLTTGTHVTSAIEEGGRVHLTLSDRTVRLVDHVLLGTGYRIDVNRYAFLSPGLRQRLRVVDGFPELEGSFGSSIPGLYFLGAPAARSFGPLMYFVSGTRFASRTLASHLARPQAARESVCEMVATE